MFKLLIPPKCFPIALMLLLFLSFFCTAQPIKKRTQKDEVVDINFLSDTSNFYWKLQYRHVYKIRLININELVYKKTTAEQKGENLFSTVPTAFTGVKLPSFLSSPITFSGPKGAGKKCDCSEAKDFIACDNVLNDRYKLFTQYLERTKVNIADFGNYETLGYELTQLSKDVWHNWDTIHGRKEAFVSAAIHRNIPIDDTAFLLKTYYNEKIDSVKFYLNGCDSLAMLIINALNDKMKDCNLTDTLRILRAQRCLGPCDTAKFYVYQDSIKKYMSYADVITKLNGDISKGKDALKEVSTAAKDGKIDAVQKTYNLLTEENFTLTVESFEAKNDLHTVTFSAEADEAQPFGRPMKKSVTFNGITKGGVKIDFSTGAFVNLGSEDFLGPKYYYINTSDSTKKIMQTKGQKSAMFSVGALMHIYPRIYSFVKPALSFGVSTTTGFETLNFHGGVSLLFGTPGTRSRVSLTGGVTLREINLVDPRYQLNTEYEGLPDDVPVLSFFPKIGGFIALTYNFASIGK